MIQKLLFSILLLSMGCGVAASIDGKGHSNSEIAILVLLAGGSSGNAGASSGSNSSRGPTVQTFTLSQTGTLRWESGVEATSPKPTTASSWMPQCTESPSYPGDTGLCAYAHIAGGMGEGSTDYGTGYCASIGMRLPTLTEFQNAYAAISPAIGPNDAGLFNGIGTGFWTSTVKASNINWTLDRSGVVSFGCTDGTGVQCTTAYFRVRCVY